MKRPTSKDVAKLAGVSQTTVSFVINNTPGVSITEETRQKVLDAVHQLHYVPNSFAKGLKTNRSKLLSVFLPSMDNPFYPMLMKHIEKYTIKLGYSVLLCCTYRNPEREKTYLDLCEEKQVEGIIYLFAPNWLERTVQLSRKIPIVLISEKSDEIPLHTISLSGFRCGQLIAEHLLQLGHQRFACLMSPVASISLTRQKRLEGMRSTIQNAGLPPDAFQVITCNLPSSENNEADAGYLMMKQVLAEKSASAVICINDLVAFGALSHAMSTKEIRVPQDISICGFDNIYLSSMTHPGLTTVEYCTESLCKLAVDMVLDYSVDSSALKLSGDPQLIRRESTGFATRW